MKQLFLMIALMLCLAATCCYAQSKPFIHPMFSNNMVLQRDVNIPIWGWADPGEEVTVIFQSKETFATADKDGKWMAHIGSYSAGGPYQITICTPNQALILKNVMVGDVWICSGQSNMQMSVGSSNNAAAEITDAANHPNIRLFSVPLITSFEPKELVNGSWQVCASNNIEWFTAVGYFFGKYIQEQTNVPIGLINTSWGGTIAEAWTSYEALKTMPDYKSTVENIQAAVVAQKASPLTEDQRWTAWWQKNDPGLAYNWSTLSLNDDDWRTMVIPGTWENAGLGEFDGIVWFRREVWLPDEWAGKALTVNLGQIDDIDSTFVNGVAVGGINIYNQQRTYSVPAGVMKPGRNILAVRVMDTGGAGGPTGPAEAMGLTVTDAPAFGTVELTGQWRMKTAAAKADLEATPMLLQEGNPNISAVLYNAMINPLVPYGIKGAIWYQGESNAGNPELYSRLLPTMITDWRSRFDVGEFPFLIVSLANFLEPATTPVDDSWANLRWSQYLTTKRVANAGLAMAIDIGDAADIHPRNKQEVGRRLGLTAMKLAYGNNDIVYSGPMYRKLTVTGNKAKIDFDFAASGLLVKGDKIQGFAIAGEDGKFVWADATIEGNSVVLSSPQVSKPTVVRYAWSINPVCNLYNKEGLPAVPFATDKLQK